MWDRKEVKENAKGIFKRNKWTLIFLALFMTVAIQRYMINNDAFSYVKMSSHYDGIYIDMYKLLFQASGNDISAKIYKFGVNSLVLFNARPIDYYQSGRVLIEPYDFEYNYHDGTTYEIKIDNEKKKILK